jgi:hypothetical protein
MSIMKNWLPVILALGVGFAAGAYWISGKKNVEILERARVSESNWEAEKARLEQELAAARNKPPRIQTVYKELPAAYTNKLNPQQILDRLIQLKPNDEESRNQAFRKIIFYMQSLVEAGSFSFAVIRDFLGQNVDVDYSQFDVRPTGERVSRGAGGFTSRNLVRTDFLVPPSLRLGLLDVLEQVGGPEAEQILADTLSTTARGVEVAYLARILQDMSPDQYREIALTAARELLINPPPIESPNRLDENAKAYLYEVLAMYKDVSFAATAQTLIVTPEGRIDPQALNYVNDVLKELAVPALLAAYNDPRVTNQREKAALLNVALAYTGPNAEANQIFFQMLTNQSIPSGVRAYSVQGLAGSSQQDRPTDPSLIKARLDFIRTIRPSLTDERVLRALDTTKDNLEKLLSGQPPSGSTP